MWLRDFTTFYFFLKNLKISVNWIFRTICLVIQDLLFDWNGYCNLKFKTHTHALETTEAHSMNLTRIRMTKWAPSQLITGRVKFRIRNAIRYKFRCHALQNTSAGINYFAGVEHIDRTWVEIINLIYHSNSVIKKNNEIALYST